MLDATTYRTLDVNIYIYKTNRGWRTRPCIDASRHPDINLSAGHVVPHEG